MHDECTAFLQWALPLMDLQWKGFRRVRSQVCKRIRRRCAEIGVAGFAGYRDHLGAHPEEWSRLDALCRITISRFHRDREIWQGLSAAVLPALAATARSRGGGRLRALSCGCASGEEPYTLAILWCGLAEVQDLHLELVGMDRDLHLLERARRASYPAASVRDLPAGLRGAALHETDGTVQLDRDHRRNVLWTCADLRHGLPGGAWDLVLCRNLAFTYFVPRLQHEVVHMIADATAPGGCLVLGSHERLPPDTADFEPWPELRATFRRC